MKEKEPSFFSELGVYMSPYKGKYILSILLSILSVTMSLLSFAFAGYIAAELFAPTPLWENVLLYLILAVACKVGNALLLNISTWISHHAAYYTLRDIRNELVAKMLRLPMGYFETNGSGRLKTLLVDHVEGMEKTLAHMLPELTACMLVPLCSIVWMFVIDWRLALAVLGWIMLGMSVTFGMMRGYETKYQGQIDRVKSMNQAVVEYVNGIEVIKNFGRTDEVYARYKDAVYDHASYDVGWQQSTQIYSALGMAIAPFTLFPVVIFGLMFFSDASIEKGTLFMMIILSFGIFGPLMNGMNYFDQLAGMGTNAKEIRAVLDEPELVRGDIDEVVDSTISMRNVSFSYVEGGEDAIHDITFDIKSGEMFALVGASGSGKSTIAKLIAGYWDARCGEILLGGNSINNYTQRAINNAIAYVDQDTFLFDKSIRDNIRLARPDATDEEVIEASRKAGCHDFISALPHGYDTLAGEGKLSGGERQRIAIVRAMMKDAPIMILDEATASTDPENEASIEEALMAASRDKTLIVVAHRLYTIKNADKIAFVKDGTIVDIGTHDELLERVEDYRRLWDISEGRVND